MTPKERHDLRVWRRSNALEASPRSRQKRHAKRRNGRPTSPRKRGVVERELDRRWGKVLEKFAAAFWFDVCRDVPLRFFGFSDEAFAAFERDKARVREIMRNDVASPSA